MKKIIVPVVCAVVSLGLLFPQTAQAATKQIYVPIVVAADLRQSSDDIAKDQIAIGELGKEADGKVHLGIQKEVAYEGDYYWRKKVEVTAIINKGITMTHGLEWYQLLKGHWITNIPKDDTNPNSPMLGFNFTSWVGDDNNNSSTVTMPYFGFRTTKVNNKREIYLYDAPGSHMSMPEPGTIEGIAGLETVDRSMNFSVEFRDYVKFKTTSAGGVFGEADIMPGVGAANFPNLGGASPVASWSTSLVMHKDANVGTLPNQTTPWVVDSYQ